VTEIQVDKNAFSSQRMQHKSVNAAQVGEGNTGQRKQHKSAKAAQRSIKLTNKTLELH
jgi:hypothetical protein